MLSIFAVVMTVIGSYYYLRVIKVMYFDKSSEMVTFNSNYIATTILVFGLIYLGLFPNILVEISSYSLADLFNT